MKWVFTGPHVNVVIFLDLVKVSISFRSYFPNQISVLLLLSSDYPLQRVKWLVKTVTQLPHGVHPSPSLDIDE